MGFYNYYYNSIKAFAPFSSLFIVDEEVVSGHSFCSDFCIDFSGVTGLSWIPWSEGGEKKGGGGEVSCVLLLVCI